MQKTKQGKESKNYADRQQPNWNKIEEEFYAIMEKAVDDAVKQSEEQLQRQFEQSLKKETSRKQFWKQAAITQGFVIATGIITGIAVYRITR